MEPRIKWIDSVRGWAIILVVLGHVFTRIGTLQIEKFLQIEIYSYHMPLFFFISGYVFKVRNEKLFDSTMRKIHNLLIPMFIFYIIYALFILIKILLGKSTLIFTFELIVNTLMMTSQSFFSAYWFLPVLFCTQMLFESLHRTMSSKSMLVIKILNIGIIISLFIVSRLLYSQGIVLPMGLREAMGALPFFALGYYTKNVNTVKRATDHLTDLVGGNKITCFVVKIIFIMIVFICITKLQYRHCNMYNSDIGSVSFYFLFGIIGILLSISFGKAFGNGMFEMLGKNSLWIFGFHYIALDIYAAIANRIIINNVLCKLGMDIVGVILVIALSLGSEYGMTWLKNVKIAK